MPNPYDELAEVIADETNAKFASELSSLTRLKDAEINKLFPSKTDKGRLLELLRIVNSATSYNEKIAKIGKNIKTLGTTIIKLVKHLA